MHIYVSPGIEPENLIRSTLIRSPPGTFFVKSKGSSSNKVTSVKRSRNIAITLQA